MVKLVSSTPISTEEMLQLMGLSDTQVKNLLSLQHDLETSHLISSGSLVSKLMSEYNKRSKFVKRSN